MKRRGILIDASERSVSEVFYPGDLSISVSGIQCFDDNHIICGVIGDTGLLDRPGSRIKGVVRKGRMLILKGSPIARMATVIGDCTLDIDAVYEQITWLDETEVKYA